MTTKIAFETKEETDSLNKACWKRSDFVDFSSHRIPKAARKIGLATYRRCIVRAGYFFEHRDMKLNEVEKLAQEIGYEMLLDCLGLRVREVMQNMNKPEIYREVTIQRLLKLFGVQFLTPARYKARAKLLHEAYKEFPQHVNMRALWYVEVEQPELCLITGITHKMTGKQYPPSSWQSSYYGDWDYEPGGLDNANRHALYTGLANPYGIYDFAAAPTQEKQIENLETWGNHVMFLPEDIEFVSSQP